MKLKYILLTIFLFVTSASIVLPQELIIVPSNEKYGAPYNWGHVIGKLEIKDGRFKKIYESNELIFWDRDIKVNNGSTLIGAVGMLQGHFADASGAGYDRSSLIVIDINGKLVMRVDDVPLFDWSPKGDKIVYATGKTYSDKDYPYTDRLWMLDLKTRKKEELVPTTKATRDVVWATFDNSIYTNESEGFFHIDPQTKQKQKTNYKDINFSPDGKYYYVEEWDPKDFRIFLRVTNSDITPSSLSKMFNVNFSKWLPDNKSLIVGDITFEKKIFDVSTGKVKKSFIGKMIGYDPKTSEIYVYRDKKIFKDLSSSKIEKIKIGE